MSKYFSQAGEDVVVENSLEDNHPSTSQPFTQEQLARMENNRKRALEIRTSKEESAEKMYLF